MTVSEYSLKTRSEAETILDTTQVVSLLSQLGDVQVGGSYFTDLMYDPDIDISVATSTPRESAILFLNQVIPTRTFQKYQYGDFEKHPLQNRPHAHIVVLILPFNERRWEIEIWFDTEHSKEQMNLEEKLRQLPLETKTKILERKAKRQESGLDKHSLPSFEIYQEYVR